MNKHLTKAAPLETLLQPDSPWVSVETDVKPYSPALLGNIKLSQSQYIATSVINYDPYIDDMFALDNFTYAFCRQLVNIITAITSHRTHP